MTELHARSGASGGLVRLEGKDYYRIDGVEHMEPFLMTVVSDTDLWLFISSTGTLTGGRVDADHAFLPYETDDRLHRASEVTGPVTIIARVVDGQREVWRPFGRELADQSTRAISKSVLGDRIVFEEHNHAWGLLFRAAWKPSRKYGWVRTSEILDVSGRGADLEVLDGLLDVMPYGVGAVTEQSSSNLVDAYKRSETGRWGTIALYTLESLISDKAEPAEALAATVIWSNGPLSEIGLDERVIAAMVEGRRSDPVQLLTGRRGSYLMRGALTVLPGQSTEWMMVVDTSVDHSGLATLVNLAAEADAVDQVVADAAAGSHRLAGLLASADGFQSTGDATADAHHLSNVLFNCMRGGVFPYGYRLPVPDFVEFLTVRNRPVSEKYCQAVSAFGDWIDLSRLLAFGEDIDDPDLIRLIFEYLPLTFSRRHGDPSRPWNRFSIQVEAPDGSELLSYEGNWRDIFQNWEALLQSFPAFIPGVVAKFVNASTIDGYNPYRISRSGVDWEVPAEGDDWSNIGYWGDHQIVYLHRLVQTWNQFDPGGMREWFDRPVFSYADVPYELASHAEMVENPRQTIRFDEPRNTMIAARVGQIGSDGRLLVDEGGDIVRVGLLEKLLVPALAKLTAFVPGGGIWMNTQRPEWNDANNALAGYGLSMVTVFHLFGYLRFLEEQIVGLGDVKVSSLVHRWLTEVTSILDRFMDVDGMDDDPVIRREMVDALGRAGTEYRSNARTGLDGSFVTLQADQVKQFLAGALEHVRRSIRSARRTDGLYDSYNLVSFPTDSEAKVDQLGVMLEGQVAVLSSGALDAADSLAVVEALFSSDLYRPDQNSFLLYPTRSLPAFPDRNTVRADVLGADPRLQSLASEKPGGLITIDVNGDLHFRSDLVNGSALVHALDRAGADADHQATLSDLYERVFQHHSFTGRSGAMHGYEGIGSIYWHMVSKLLLSVQETLWAARSSGAPPELVGRLAAAYRKIREGLGFRKSPVEFGAIPLDCYSHTPAHAGAQQPGMTGQVKEQVIVRLGELGVRVVDGRIHVDPILLLVDELVSSDGCTSFSFCRVPMELRPGDEAKVQVHQMDGQLIVRPGPALTRAESKDIFEGGGKIIKVVFDVPVAKQTTG